MPASDARSGVLLRAVTLALLAGTLAACSNSGRFEVNNPQMSTEWLPLFEVDEDQLAASQELKDELNRINAPIQLRLVCNSV